MAFFKISISVYLDTTLLHFFLTIINLKMYHHQFYGRDQA